MAKGKHRVRIISGDLKGRLLDYPKQGPFRPTMQRTRSSVFETLGAAIEDSVFVDLFAAAGETPVACSGIDGHSLKTSLETRVCNWLYLAQLAHAYQRALPLEELVCADFYVPEGNVYIDCWEAEIPARELSGKLHKRELYRQLDLRHIEINATDVERLDEVLGRGLLSFGIRC